MFTYIVVSKIFKCSMFYCCFLFNSQPAELNSHGEYNWGKISSQYIAAQWSCLYHMLSRNCSAFTGNMDALLKSCIDTLDVVSEDDIVPVLNSLSLLCIKVNLQFIVHLLVHLNVLATTLKCGYNYVCVFLQSYNMS